ncbi:MAG: ArnT family glycosyltransferase [Candidatus Polarisedimenticolia bacterium]
MLTALPHAAAVVDEPAHLTAGLLAAAQGDLTVNREHPPLVKVLAALSASSLSPVLPPEPEGIPRASSDFAFAYARDVLYKANDADRLLQRARLPIVALTLLAGLVLFLWGRALAGPWPAVAALALFAFEPNLLAHGRLVTTDMGAALFSLATLACMEHAQRTQGRLGPWDVAAGVSLGLALLTRFSSVLLLPVMGACLLADRNRDAASRWTGALVCMATALVVLQAGYVATGGVQTASLFPLAASATGEPLRTQPMAGLEAGHVTRWLPLPVPRLWLEGLDLARWKNANVEGPTYLDGAMSRDGWWSWFVMALAMKGTLPFLVMSAAGLIWLSFAGPRLHATRVWAGLPAVALLALTTALTRAQIGLRYVLPVIPLLCLCAMAPLAAPGRRPVRALLAVALIAWHAVAALSIHPYHLAYFNEAAGGPQAGPRRLVDSNLDWGQDLVGLAAFLEKRDIPRVNLYYFGTADPDYHGIARAPAPEAGWYAVSATHLAGVYLPDPDYLASFRTLRPDADIGHSILLYRLDHVPERLTKPLRRP